MTTKNALTPVQRLKNILEAESVQEQFRNALADSAPLFVASLIDVYSGDKRLQECEPGAVVMEALQAATLRLPINRNLGFAFIVAYRNKGKMEPAMQLGYKGYIQLAMRTGEYRYLNTDVVYEGELKSYDKLTGHIDLIGTKTSDKVIGYFAHLELLNGYSKTVYWTKQQVEAHGRKYAPSFHKPASAWQTDFDAMAKKTTIRDLISKWGIMSIEMMGAVARDIKADQAEVYDEIAENANTEELDIIDAEFSEEQPTEEQPKASEGPGF